MQYKFRFCLYLTRFLPFPFQCNCLVTLTISWNPILQFIDSVIIKPKYSGAKGFSLTFCEYVIKLKMGDELRSDSTQRTKQSLLNRNFILIFISFFLSHVNYFDILTTKEILMPMHQHKKNDEFFRRNIHDSHWPIRLKTDGTHSPVSFRLSHFIIKRIDKMCPNIKESIEII